MKSAEYWHNLEEDRVQCDLCPHHCKLSRGETGLCKARGVREGDMKALCYGMVSSSHIDPIEKKPLYHFHPGSMIFSVGGWGCNFACDFCQNWSISQEVLMEAERCSPQNVVEQASVGGSIGIAYTYNEPLVGFEFVRDCARLIKARGLSNVLVTNGYIEREPAAELLTLVDALNIDIKSMTEGFYATHCRGRLSPVLSFAAQARAASCHVEITTLVIPGLNDEESELRSLANWIGENLGRETPLHLSAYHPQYRMNVPATSLSCLERAFVICSEQLDHVYIGNVISEAGQDTRCPSCEASLIVRRGYAVTMADIAGDECSRCGRRINIVSGTDK